MAGGREGERAPGINKDYFGLPGDPEWQGKYIQIINTKLGMVRDAGLWEPRGPPGTFVGSHGAAGSPGDGGGV